MAFCLLLCTCTVGFAQSERRGGIVTGDPITMDRADFLAYMEISNLTDTPRYQKFIAGNEEAITLTARELYDIVTDVGTEEEVARQYGRDEGCTVVVAYDRLNRLYTVNIIKNEPALFSDYVDTYPKEHTRKCVYNANVGSLVTFRAEFEAGYMGSNYATRYVRGSSELIVEPLDGYRTLLEFNRETYTNSTGWQYNDKAWAKVSAWGTGGGFNNEYSFKVTA